MDYDLDTAAFLLRMSPTHLTRHCNSGNVASFTLDGQLRITAVEIARIIECRATAKAEALASQSTKVQRAAATVALEDRRTFVLAEAAWDDFIAMLDAPAQPCPKLVELFARPKRIRN